MNGIEALKGQLATAPRASLQRPAYRSGSRHAVAWWVVVAAATCAAVIGSILSGLVVGVTTLGIDDANITQIYAKNISSGLGYVFYPGGERVEGSTSFLWTALNVVSFRVSSQPELAILAMSFFLSVLSGCLLIRMTIQISVLAGIPQKSAFFCIFVLLCASPSFFLWSVWTLMDVALWVACTLWLVASLVNVLTRPERDQLFDASLILPAVCAVHIRPEGVAVACGLLLATGLVHAGATRCLSYAFQRRLLLALAATVAAFALVTTFRLAYFGVPFPNTFYAKVSSDHLRTILDGMRYFGGFLLRTPWMAEGFLCWLLAGGWATISLARARGADWRLPAAMLLVSLAVVGFALTYVALGGDHFAFFRFYQPVLLLCLLPLALCCAYAASRIAPPSAALRYAIVAVLTIGVMARGTEHLTHRGSSITREFHLAQFGRQYGEALTALSGETGPFTLATVPAGGVTHTFRGPVFDLLGLNWSEMAHRSRAKLGIRNHASFDATLFWQKVPDVIYLDYFNLAADGFVRPRTVTRFTQDALKGLLTSPEFQQAYLPVAFGRYEVIASRAWLDRHPQAPVSRLAWPQFTFE